DTAGLRDTGDAVEAEGVRRARAHIDRADLVLMLRPIDSEADQSPAQQSVLRLATKADLPGARRGGELRLPAPTGLGLDDLLIEIRARSSALGQSEPAMLTRERHRAAVADAIAALDRAVASGQDHVELLAEDLRLAVAALQRLVGRIGVEDVLDQLFQGF